ncbi:Hypothetical protein FKW44_007361 [Caligus rogercresseyi]|uniref:Resolvase HTH domain-containing protein n=1 Tax=Caligus rogercresseyi TaxID=217165 RepID=A0A7T8KEN3_CALRO|nr:Hypothetical protein FKW44_007361 [Caligus rogercresseyi]
MEQEKRSAIIVLARAGRTTSEIIKTTKLPRSKVFRVLNRHYKQCYQDTL